MDKLNELSYERFKREVCERCDIIYDLKRRENIIVNILNQYAEVENESIKQELKYDLGAESVRNVFKNRCIYVDRCDEVQEYLNRITDYEVRLSKLMYELMMQEREKDVYYISADIDPFYPVLSNRIVRCDRSKKAIIKDKYDTKDLLEKFKNVSNSSNSSNSSN